MSEPNQDLLSPRLLGTVLIAWLVPGGGFFVNGRFWRGLILLAVLLPTFLLGCRLHAGVAWPSWNTSDESFNIINNITFLIQMGAGLPALVSLLASRHPEMALHWADTKNAFYDLGSFYLLVCGAMNYFVICNTYDRLFGHWQSRTAAKVDAS